MAAIERAADPDEVLLAAVREAEHVGCHLWLCFETEQDADDFIRAGVKAQQQRIEKAVSLLREAEAFASRMTIRFNSGADILERIRSFLEQQGAPSAAHRGFPMTEPFEFEL